MTEKTVPGLDLVVTRYDRVSPASTQATQGLFPVSSASWSLPLALFGVCSWIPPSPFLVYNNFFAIRKPVSVRPDFLHTHDPSLNQQHSITRADTISAYLSSRSFCSLQFKYSHHSFNRRTQPRCTSKPTFCL